MNELETLLSTYMKEDQFVELLLSNSLKPLEVTKMKLRPILLKGKKYIQAERFSGKQAFHENLTYEEAAKKALSSLSGTFKQGELLTTGHKFTILTNKKGTVTIKKRTLPTTDFKCDMEVFAHNRTKQYVIPEGTIVPYLVSLGVMDEKGHIHKSHYDKFRQINRFLEFVRDIIPNLPKNRKLTIVDFGCGKSYLTFAIYDYLKLREGFDVTIIGLDLKEKVISDCQALADKLGYTDLHFLCGDIADYTGVNAVDMVVTLHACDLATDYAIAKAVSWGAKVILSVPCCQHELNRQIGCEPLSSIFSYGLIKERTAALFTDAIRANLLETRGYRTQLLEFIDMEHTPKNILIRAVYTGRKTKDMNEIDKLCDYLQVDPTLRTLLNQQTDKDF